MLKQELFIVNKLGLHARAAAKLVKLACGFESTVQLRREHREINAKSIMGVMLLAAGKGTQVELIVSGRDETHAMYHLMELIQSGFGEDE